jgi:hypothetical protein
MSFSLYNSAGILYIDTVAAEVTAITQPSQSDGAVSGNKKILPHSGQARKDVLETSGKTSIKKGT